MPSQLPGWLLRRQEAGSSATAVVMIVAIIASNGEADEEYAPKRNHNHIPDNVFNICFLLGSSLDHKAPNIMYAKNPKSLLRKMEEARIRWKKGATRHGTQCAARCKHPIHLVVGGSGITNKKMNVYHRLHQVQTLALLSILNDREHNSFLCFYPPCQSLIPNVVW